ncbi:STAS domain-containing protein [Candidatus Latescibacterota bacterium]
MDITTKQKNSINIISITGSLDSATSPQAQELILPMIVPESTFVMDLSKCGYISSSGLRLLLMITKKLSSQNGIWALAGVLDEVKDVIDITGFSSLLVIYDTVEDAILALTNKQ